MLIPFELMYRLRFAPWELRPVVPAWQRITGGPDALPPGRALDVGDASMPVRTGRPSR